jgi:hypothetical protein
LVNFICGARYTQYASSDATLLFLEMTTMMLPKLYAISAMWTLNSRKELSSQFGGDVSSSSEKFSSRQMATTTRLGRRSVDGGSTARIESPEEMMDIPEHMFEPRTEPYPDDINGLKSTRKGPTGGS